MTTGHIMNTVRGQMILDHVFPVVEIFSSIQGEGFLIGQPCDFIRLAGCNMNPSCSYCDTKYAQGEVSGTDMPVRDIIKQLTRKPVVVTGGEPCRFQRLDWLVEALIHHGHVVTIETNGTLFRPEVMWHTNVLSISPKLPNAGHMPNMPVLRAWRDAWVPPTVFQLKFVISDSTDIDVAVQTLDELLCACSLQFECGLEVVFQPEGSGDILDRMRWLTVAIADRAFFNRFERVYILPQLHKLLWGNERGV